jgi:hypothetical protein
MSSNGYRSPSPLETRLAIEHSRSHRRHAQHSTRADPNPQGGCFRGVDFLLEGPPEFIAIDEKTNHQIMHLVCFGETNRATHPSLDPRPQVNMLAVAVGGRITPPTAVPDRSGPVSVHSDLQYPDACHALQAGFLGLAITPPIGYRRDA